MQAMELISRVQAMEEELKMLRSGVAVLLHDTTPVPRANAQLRRFCADLRGSDFPLNGPTDPPRYPFKGVWGTLTVERIS